MNVCESGGSWVRSYHAWSPVDVFRLTALLGLLAIIGVAQILAAEPAPVDPNETVVRQAVDAYRKAVELGDVDTIASFWSPNADYVDYLGRAYKIDSALIRARGRAREDGHISRPAPKTETLAIRLIAPDVAVEDGTVERVSAAGGTPTAGRYCAMWVKKDGKWLIDGVRESPYRAPAGGDHFQDLEWMLGEWVAEGPHGTAEVSCTWGPDKKYILRTLTVKTKEEGTISATQWIGWDPIHDRVRSFVFDSRGGYAEGTWAKEGDAWIATTTGVLPDGRRTTATNIYSRVDENTAIWESVDDETDGRPTPDIRFRATRKSPRK
jgi:uncharacterized protein (TIGR02246 family)